MSEERQGRRRLSPSTTLRTDMGRGASTNNPKPVEIVIACHNPQRPVDRAIASIIDANPEAAVTLVCHNRPAEDFAHAIAPQRHQLVRYLEHDDPRPSPAGPFNAGMEAVESPFFAIMGSDDRLAPGAVASWLRLARCARADMVLTRLTLGRPTTHVPTPPVRACRLLAPHLLHLLCADSPARSGTASRSGTAQNRRTAPGHDAVSGQHANSVPRRTLIPAPVARAMMSMLSALSLADFAADRLAYRSAPLGLIRTSFYRDRHLQLVQGLAVGEDQALAVHLYSTGRIVYDSSGPCYLIGEDAGDRVTTTLRPIRQELAFLPSLTDPDAPARLAEILNLSQRRALAVKIARISLFGAVHYRPTQELWSQDDRLALADAVQALHAFAPGWTRVLSLAERRLLTACAQVEVPTDELLAASHARRQHGRPRTLVTRNPAMLAHSQGPIRLMAASLMCRAMPGYSDSWAPQGQV